jgi:hypothetical protein
MWTKKGAFGKWDFEVLPKNGNVCAACLSTVTLELQKFQYNSPHNLREPPRCERFTSVRVMVILILQECLEAGQNGDA